MSATRARWERLIGDAAFLGSATAFLTLLAYPLVNDSFPGWVVVPEQTLLAVLGLAPRLLLGANLVTGGHSYMLVPILIGLLIWPRTRHAAITALLIGATLASIWLGALSSFLSYVMDHRLGPLCLPLGLLPAVALARWWRGGVLPMVVVTSGFYVGVTIGVVFQHDVPAIVTPLHRFLPTALLSLLAGWWVSRRSPSPTDTTARRFLRMWGLCATCVGCVFVVAVATDKMRPRPRPAQRAFDSWAYDVHVIGEPPQLVWTDRDQIHVLTDPYGEAHDSYVLSAANHRYPQRIWPSPSSGFYVQMIRGVGWWKAAPDGRRFSSKPAVLYTNEALQNGSPWAIAEDPIQRSVFTISEWRSYYAWMDRDSAAPRDSGRLSSAIFGVWHVTPDLPARRILVSSGLEDGNLYEVNLDSHAITRKAAFLYVYETVLDRQRHLLWGVRPVTGEVVGVDADTFSVRHRIHTGFGARDLQLDPDSGNLFTCSLFGDVFRVDTAAQTATRLAWCGRVCRNLFLDKPRSTLWVATDDGICRLDPDAAGERS